MDLWVGEGRPKARLLPRSGKLLPPSFAPCQPRSTRTLCTAQQEKSQPAPEQAKQAKPSTAKQVIKASPAALVAPAVVPVAPPTLPLPAAAPLVDASLLNGLAVGDTAVLPSSSGGGGGGYLIKRLPDSKWTCSCPDFKFRKRKLGLECKHIQAVRAGIPPQSIIKARRTPSAHHTTAPCYRWRWPRETRLAPGKLASWAHSLSSRP